MGNYELAPYRNDGGILPEFDVMDCSDLFQDGKWREIPSFGGCGPVTVGDIGRIEFPAPDKDKNWGVSIKRKENSMRRAEKRKRQDTEKRRERRGAGAAEARETAKPRYHLDSPFMRVRVGQLFKIVGDRRDVKYTGVDLTGVVARAKKVTRSPFVRRPGYKMAYAVVVFDWEGEEYCEQTANCLPIWRTGPTCNRMA